MSQPLRLKKKPLRADSEQDDEQAQGQPAGAAAGAAAGGAAAAGGGHAHHGDEDGSGSASVGSSAAASPQDSAASAQPQYIGAQGAEDGAGGAAAGAQNARQRSLPHRYLQMSATREDGGQAGGDDRAHSPGVDPDDPQQILLMRKYGHLHQSAHRIKHGGRKYYDSADRPVKGVLSTSANPRHGQLSSKAGTSQSIHMRGAARSAAPGSGADDAGDSTAAASHSEAASAAAAGGASGVHVGSSELHTASATISTTAATSAAAGAGAGPGVLAGHPHGLVHSSKAHGSVSSIAAAASAGVAATPAAAVPEGGAGGGKQHVLLVEDVRVSQRVARVALSRARYRVEIAADGLDAIEKYTNGDHDVILMDIHLPNKDGVTATKEIRQLEQEMGRRKVLIFGLTGSMEDDEIERYRAAGMDGCIAKGMLLVKAVNNALEQHAMNPEQFVISRLE